MKDNEDPAAALAERLEAISPELALSAITRAPFAMVLTNPRLPDNPIVYVNRAFEIVTGYASEAAVGRNCRFLQGEDTDPAAIQRLRAAISERAEVTVDLKNYRADGAPFWNRLMLAPLLEESGEAAFFMGVQLASKAAPKDPAGTARLDGALREIQHRVKNHLAMIVGMIRMQAAQVDAAHEDFKTLARRIETLQLLYEELMKPAAGPGQNSDDVALGAYLTRVATAISYLDGRSGVRVNIDADAVTVPFDTATQIGLVLSEIMTNTMQHAFAGRDAGLVDVRIKEMSGGTLRVQVTDDGIGIPEDVAWPDQGNLGGRIVSQLSEGLGAKLAVQRGGVGTTVTLDVPRDATNA
jgi:PAS domain S-box-containing protein